MADQVRIVTSLDPPRLALIGYFDESDEARIRALRSQLDIARRGSRYVSYQDAEAHVSVLGEKLTAAIGSEALSDAAFVAIPRGGHVVLGMLSYELGVGREQVESTDADLWVVVDDCSLSGARFLEWLTEHPGPEVAFAHLMSHPELRRRLEATPRVRTSVAAQDLTDHAFARLGDEYSKWLAKSMERSSGVWVGQTDHLAFAWNEPDTSIWNPVTEQEERGWHLVGPSRCLKNRHSAQEGTIQVLPPAHGDLRPGMDVMWAVLGDEVIVADVASDRVVGITGAGSAMWIAVTRATTEHEALNGLSKKLNVDATRLRSDWNNFISPLIELGLLVRT
jgi:hypothetical protein